MLFIFEGMDNTGKDTQIELLKKTIQYSLNKDIKEYHWVGPDKNLSDKEKVNQYILLMEDKFNEYLNNSNSITIWNRSHLGEYVYGQLYRNTEPEKWLFLKEQELYNSNNVFRINTFLIQLEGDIKHLINNDDGLSYSIEKNTKKKEKDLFRIAYNQSCIQKKILINVSENSTTFVDKYKIQELIVKYVLDNSDLVF